MYYRDQILCTICNCTGYTFTRLAKQKVCLHQHHHKRMSNVLHSDVMTAATSLGSKNFSVPLSYGTTVVFVVGS